MFSKIKALYKLLTSEQRRRLLRLQVLVILMAFAEVASVAAIGPFMALVGDMSSLQGAGTLAQLYQASGFNKPSEFLFWLGMASLLALCGAAAISMFATWRLAMYGAQIGEEISTRLYKHYMQQPWLFHASGNSVHLTNKIAQESGRVTNQIIQPLMQMNAKVTMALVMTSAVFLFNPLVALIGLLLFGTAYLLLYRTVRHSLARNGKDMSHASRQRFKLMNEGFGGIKDTLLLGRQADFNERYKTASARFSHAQGTTRALSQVPRYAMELIAFGAVIFLVLYLLAVYEGNPGHILPVLAVYALAGFKLLPAFQQIYTSIASVRGNLAAFDALEKDLFESRYVSEVRPAVRAGKLTPHNKIELENVTFRYPGKQETALKALNITLPVNQVIGLVGASGSGKSTAVDVLLGLIQPQEGYLKVDDQPVTEERLRAWQNNLGYVSQSIFLADASIRENIAFGVPSEQIDDGRVARSAKMAHLDEMLQRLPDGLNTRVGERGIQLSGGQRQRIGIARALYDDAAVLVLDEATSALDGISEKLVMDAIHDFAGKKTIVMIAHRLTTVKQCDVIYVIDDGRVVDFGTYRELFEKNPEFRRMADSSI